MFTCIFIFQFICLPPEQSTCLFAFFSTFLPVLPVHLQPFYLPTLLPIYFFTYLHVIWVSIFLHVCESIIINCNDYFRPPNVNFLTFFLVIIFWIQTKSCLNHLNQMLRSLNNCHFYTLCFVFTKLLHLYQQLVSTSCCQYESNIFWINLIGCSVFVKTDSIFYFLSPIRLRTCLF